MDLRFTKIGLNFKQNSGPQHCKSRVCRIFMILKSRILKSRIFMILKSRIFMILKAIAP